jgi:hypothetical protein
MVSGWSETLIMVAAQTLEESYYGRLQGLKVVGKRNPEPDNLSIVLRDVGFALIYMKKAEG